jgi:vanillate O-demethylase ferredoxin subunit
VNATTRNAILAIHRWAGLTVGLVGVFLALTGASMVFRSQLQPIEERALRGMPVCTARLPLDSLIARALRSHPGAKAEQVELFDGGRGVTIVRLAGLRGVYLNSCTGAIVGEKDRWGGFFGFVEWLHRLRFAGNADVTELIGGSVSLVLALVVVLGGLSIAWPRNLRALRNAARLRWKLKGAAFDVSVHRTLGLYVSAVLLMSTVTSLTFTFEWARHAVFAATGSSFPAKKPLLEARAAPAASAEALLASTLSLVSDAREIQVQFPRKAGAAVEVQALEGDAPHANARTFLYLDPATAEVVRLEPFRSASAGVKAYRWLGALHQGQVGGLAMQLVLFAGILGVPVLAFTGVRGYLRRRLSRG